jgi:methionyl aminopeptidase
VQVCNYIMSKKIILKTDEEIEIIRQNCLLVSKTLAFIAEHLKEGVLGSVLDSMAEEFIRDHGAVPGFKGLYGCPSTLLISKNEVVVHGLPDEVPYKSGDILSIDCGVYHNDYYGDAAYTFVLGDVSEEVMKLLVVTKESLAIGIDKARVDNRLGDVSFAIQNYTERENPYSVVRELVGHGVGKKLHEKPEVPNYGKRGSGVRLEEGLVIAIEPMVNMGTKAVRQAKDGWTIYTKDLKPSAHYEHTVAVRKDGPDILSDHGIIEESINKNENLKNISLKK